MMQLKNTKTNTSLYSNPTSIPSIARLQALISISSKGIITGKLKTGMSKLLFPALEAMADNIVKVPANPMQPNTVKPVYNNIF